MALRLEARPYGPDSTSEEVEAMRARVYLCGDDIVMYRELPVMSLFSVGVLHQRVDELARPLPSFSLLVDVRQILSPDAELRRRLKLMLRSQPHMRSVAIVTGGDFIATVAARFVLSDLDMDLTIHEKEEDAFATLRSPRPVLPEPNDLASRVLRSLLEISCGHCSITPETILAEQGNRPVAEILAGLLCLHEDLEHREQLRAAAEAEVLRRVEDTRQANLKLVRANDELDAKGRELQSLNEQLKTLDALKTQFFANVSHEFRTPLTLLLGPIEELLGSARTTEPRERAHLETAHRAATRLLKLVNTLLDFSRLEAGKVSARYEPTDLSALTANVASTFRSAIESAGLSFVVDCHPLPEPVYVDQEMWEKIVGNLLSNALKFTFEGSITVRLRPTGSNVRLDIQDTGIGIALPEVTHVFERFHRIHGARARSHEGSGIGLALVDELAKLHRGSTSVESVENVGSTFSVVIPLGHAHLPSSALETSRSPHPSTATVDAYVQEASRWVPDGDRATRASADGADGRPRILLADDNADMREYLAGLLASRWDVDVATNGRQARAAIAKRLPDLVITDIMMPEMSGFELLSALRHDPRTRDVPIIMLSARAGEESRVEGIEAGADDYLVKPFSARELLARVDTQLTLVRMREASARSAEALAGMKVHQQWLESVLDRLPIPLLLVDPHSEFIGFANIAAVRMAGGDLAPGTWLHRQTITDEDGRVLSVAERPLARIRRGERVEGVTIVWRTPRGPIPLLVDGDELPAMHAHPRTAVLAFQDVSQLMKAIRSRDEFLSMASHELKTPLTSLKLQIESRARLLSKGSTGLVADKLQSMIDADKKQVDRLVHLVDDMLDVSRISSGKLTLELEETELGALVGEVIERLAPQLHAAGCRTTLDVEERVSAPWDRQRIERVVINLLMNATKYAPNAPIQCTVRVVSGPDGARMAQLLVRDNGVGIAPEDHERIFLMFERVSRSTDWSGLGLGLSIARQIVAAHGGTLRVSSKLGEGATFVMELPVASGAERGS